MKEIVFHCDLSTSDAFEVSVDGDMATKDQLDAILRTLNNSDYRTVLADDVRDLMEREAKK